MHQKYLSKYLSLALVVLLLNVLLATPALGRPQSSSTTQNQDVEKIRIKVARLGVGEKARATVHLKDGTKIKGYIAQAGSDDFVIRDRKTNEARTIAYQDAVKVDSNRGHSLARNLAIGIAIGAGAIIAILAILIAHEFD
jgi:hypothetical protein